MEKLIAVTKGNNLKFYLIFVPANHWNNILGLGFTPLNKNETEFLNMMITGFKLPMCSHETNFISDYQCLSDSYESIQRLKEYLKNSGIALETRIY